MWGTIEGYPTFETMLAQLKAAKAKSVTLVPFMFVAGDHAKNDIAGEWREMLEKEGYTVHVRMEGLGQIPEIQKDIRRPYPLRTEAPHTGHHGKESGICGRGKKTSEKVTFSCHNVINRMYLCELQA